MPIDAASLILCERAISDRVEGRTYLFRILTQFRASMEPTSPVGFNVFAILTGDAHERGVVRLRCVPLSYSGRNYFQAFGPVTIGSEGKTQLNLRIEDFSFPRFGVYEFQLDIENRIVARLTVHVQSR